MATKQRRIDPSARTLSTLSLLGVLFAVPAVLFGGPALATAGVLSVMAAAVLLLLSVGTYLSE